MACASDVSLVGVLTSALDLTEGAEVRLVGCLPSSLSSFPHSCWLPIRGGLLGVQLLLVSLALQMSLVRLHTHTHTQLKDISYISPPLTMELAQLILHTSQKYTAWLLGLYFFPPNLAAPEAAAPAVFWTI